jgi:hypothetical protein
MSSDQKVVIQRQGVGFCGLLFVVLLVLKLGVGDTAVVGLSWWIVTLPLWAPTVFLLGLVVVVLLATLICWASLLIVDKFKK